MAKKKLLKIHVITQKDIFSIYSKITQCETWSCLVEHKSDIVVEIEERHT